MSSFLLFLFKRILVADLLDQNFDEHFKLILPFGTFNLLFSILTAVLDALEQVENGPQLRSLNNPEASVPNANQPSYCYSSHQPNFTQQREKPLYSTQPIRTNPKFFQNDTNLSQPLQIRTDFADRANFGSNAVKRQTQKQTYQVENSVTLLHRIAKEPYNVQNTPHNMGGTSQRISKHQAVSRIDISSNNEQTQQSCDWVCLTHRVISDRVHRLLVTLSYFRPDRFVQLLSLIPILILLLHLLVSIDLDHTGLITIQSLGESN